jgi:hypothetical protein
MRGDTVDYYCMIHHCVVRGKYTTTKRVFHVYKLLDLPLYGMLDILQ